MFKLLHRIDNYATKTELSSLQTDLNTVNSDLAGYVQTSTLNNYATKTELSSLQTDLNTVNSDLAE